MFGNTFDSIIDKMFDNASDKTCEDSIYACSVQCAVCSAQRAVQCNLLAAHWQILMAPVLADMFIVTLVELPMETGLLTAVVPHAPLASIQPSWSLGCGYTAVYLRGWSLTL